MLHDSEARLEKVIELLPASADALGTSHNAVRESRPHGEATFGCSDW